MFGAAVVTRRFLPMPPGMADARLVRDDPEKAARWSRLGAVQSPIHHGLGLPACPRIVHMETDSGTCVMLLYTRDASMHESGWFKNPDYERCWHLSISMFVYQPFAREQFHMLDYDRRRGDDFARLVLGEWLRYAWIESAKSKEASGRVWHFRVFTDPQWQPIMPRGEVYTREFTEAGWKSWSELHAGDDAASHLAHENPERG